MSDCFHVSCALHFHPCSMSELAAKKYNVLLFLAVVLFFYCLRTKFDPPLEESRISFFASMMLFGAAEKKLQHI